MTDSEILKNVLEALINSGRVVSLNDLAKKLPHSYSSLNRIKNGEEGYNLSAGLREKLERPPFNVSKGYMLNGTGDVLEESKKSDDESHLIGPSNDAIVKALALIQETVQMLRESHESIIDDNRLFRSLLEPYIKKGNIKLDLKNR